MDRFSNHFWDLCHMTLNLFGSRNNPLKAGDIASL